MLLLFCPLLCSRANRSDVDLEITKWDVKPADGTLEAHWRFSAILDLPWKPRLAAAGGNAVQPAWGCLGFWVSQAVGCQGLVFNGLQQLLCTS